MTELVGRRIRWIGDVGRRVLPVSPSWLPPVWLVMLDDPIARLERALGDALEAPPSDAPSEARRRTDVLARRPVAASQARTTSTPQAPPAAAMAWLSPRIPGGSFGRFRSVTDGAALAPDGDEAADAADSPEACRVQQPGGTSTRDPSRMHREAEVRTSQAEPGLSSRRGGPSLGATLPQSRLALAWGPGATKAAARESAGPSEVRSGGMRPEPARELPSPRPLPGESDGRASTRLVHRGPELGALLRANVEVPPETASAMAPSVAAATEVEPWRARREPEAPSTAASVDVVLEALYDRLMLELLRSYGTSGE